MKKLLLISIVIMMILSSYVGIGNTIINEDVKLNESNASIFYEDFTHTVFAEECTANWCPNCPIAAEALYNIYHSEDYPFYYVALVDDMNPIAKKRNQQYTFNVYAFPTVYFDGGNTNFVGHVGTVPGTENEYRLLIEEEGQRNPKQPISLESNVSWDGNAKLTVTITATNEGTSPYIGILRSYVNEIESRWVDKNGNPYHFAFLDYAIKKLVILMPNKPKVFTGVFDGNADHEGQSYGDITEDNILVISTVSHIIPQIRQGYSSPPYNQQYIGFFVDQTVGSIPN